MLTVRLTVRLERVTAVTVYRPAGTCRTQILPPLVLVEATTRPRAFLKRRIALRRLPVLSMMLPARVLRPYLDGLNGPGMERGNTNALVEGARLVRDVATLLVGRLVAVERRTVVLLVVGFL